MGGVAVGWGDVVEYPEDLVSQCGVVGVDGGGAVEEELLHEVGVAAAKGFGRRESGRAENLGFGHLGPV